MKKITISKSQWDSLGKTASEDQFLVSDDEFNRANYPDLIGKKFTSPPAYAHVLNARAINQMSREIIANLSRSAKTLEVIGLGNIAEGIRKKITEIQNLTGGQA